MDDYAPSGATKKQPKCHILIGIGAQKRSRNLYPIDSICLVIAACIVLVGACVRRISMAMFEQ